MDTQPRPGDIITKNGIDFYAQSVDDVQVYGVKVKSEHRHLGDLSEVPAELVRIKIEDWQWYLANGAELIR